MRTAIHSAVRRLGVIDYLNVAPVYDALRHDPACLPGVDLVAGVPSEMNARLLAGEIDLSNVSSVALGGTLTSGCLCLALSVAAQEKVESVLLFSWHADWRAGWRLDRALPATPRPRWRWCGCWRKSATAHIRIT